MNTASPPAASLAPRWAPKGSIQVLAPLLARIEARYRPLQVWLFGSRARGDHRPASDWDLLIVVPDDAPDADLDLLTAWKVQHGLAPLYADLVPLRASDFREDLGVVNTLQNEVSREGVLVYER